VTEQEKTTHTDTPTLVVLLSTFQVNLSYLFAPSSSFSTVSGPFSADCQL